MLEGSEEARDEPETPSEDAPEAGRWKKTFGRCERRVRARAATMEDSPVAEEISQTSTAPSATTFRSALQSPNVPGLPNEQLQCKVAVVVADLVGVQLVELREMLVALLT